MESEAKMPMAIDSAVAMSVEIDKLAAALAKAQGEIRSAEKDSENPYFHSKYADLSKVWDACRDALSKNGLAIIQTTDGSENIVLYTTLAHSSGQWIRSKLMMKPVKMDPQGIGSCLTYARRYSLMAIVGVAPDSSEDDDGNAASGTNKEPDKKEPGKKEPVKKFVPRNKDVPSVDDMVKTGQAIPVAPPVPAGEEVDKKLKTLMELSGINMLQLRAYLEGRTFIKKGAPIMSMTPETYQAIILDQNWNIVVNRIKDMKGN